MEDSNISCYVDNDQLVDKQKLLINNNNNENKILNYNSNKKYYKYIFIFITLSIIITSLCLIFLLPYDSISCNSDICITIPNIGRVEGIVLPFTSNPNKTYTTWKGIPFAEIPINNLRWKPPISKSPWNNILETKEFKDICYQDKIFDIIGYNQSEDCLYLNIFRSNKYNGSKLPVFIWIYGGGFIMGEASNPKYNPQHLIDRGVIFVSFNYRLGILGFGVNKMFDAEDPNHPTSGNYGILDQRLAMKWVKDNIAAFGGDENNITILGESAGSISICFHLVDTSISNLFNAAILQSGPCIQNNVSSPIIYNKDVIENFTNSFIAPFNCSSLKCLRDIPAEDIFLYQNQYQTINIITPCIDNIIIVNPVNAFISGNYNHVFLNFMFLYNYQVPMIVGDVANEGTIFVLQIVTPDDYNSYIEANFPLYTYQIRNMYPLSNNISPYYAIASIYGDFYFVCPSKKMARYAASYSDVYYYWFDHIPSFGNTSALVYHSSDVSFMFDSSYVDIMTPAEQKLANIMMDYWTSFAIQGKPYSDGNSVWNVVNSNSTFSYMNLNTPLVMMQSLSIDEKCDFWDNL